MELIKKILEALFSPVGALAVLAGAGLLLSFVRRGRNAGFRFLICAGFLFLFFLFSPMAKFAILGLERQYPPLLQPPQSKGIDRIAVLSGYAEEHPGMPVTSIFSTPTVCSMAEGLRLYRLVPGAKLIASGGIVRKGDRPIAATMADFLKQTGVPTDDLVVEGNSRNTYENLVELKKIVGTRPFILVAQACDMKRAVAVAHKLQMRPIPAPACFWAAQRCRPDMSFREWTFDFFAGFAHPLPENLSRLQWACHEYVGIAWYRLLGRI